MTNAAELQHGERCEPEPASPPLQPRLPIAIHPILCFRIIRVSHDLCFDFPPTG